MQTVSLFHLSIVAEPSNEVMDEMIAWVTDKKKCRLVGTPNPEQIVLAQKNQDFQRQLLDLDYRLPDGEGIVWASRVLSKFNHSRSIPERIAGIEVLDFLLQQAFEKQLTVLVVGGRRLHNLQVKLNSGENFQISSVNYELHQPDVRKSLIWWLEGYQDVTHPTQAEEKVIDNLVQELQPHMVFVALGAPSQEKWLSERRALLRKNGVRLGMTVGGAFDMLTGKIPRAPQSWQNLRLEWFWRLIQEPWRWRRQLALVEFVWLVLKTKFMPV